MELVWVADDWLTAQDVTPWSEIPLWRTAAGAWQVSSEHAWATGLSCRPLPETVADTWDWLRREDPVPHERATEMGLDAVKEERLLAAWPERARELSGRELTPAENTRMRSTRSAAGRERAYRGAPSAADALSSRPTRGYLQEIRRDPPDRIERVFCRIQPPAGQFHTGKISPRFGAHQVTEEWPAACSAMALRARTAAPNRVPGDEQRCRCAHRVAGLVPAVCPTDLVMQFLCACVPPLRPEPGPRQQVLTKNSVHRPEVAHARAAMQCKRARAVPRGAERSSPLATTSAASRGRPRQKTTSPSKPAAQACSPRWPTTSP